MAAAASQSHHALVECIRSTGLELLMQVNGSLESPVDDTAALAEPLNKFRAAVDAWKQRALSPDPPTAKSMEVLCTLKAQVRDKNLVLKRLLTSLRRMEFESLDL